MPARLTGFPDVFSVAAFAFKPIGRRDAGIRAIPEPGTNLDGQMCALFASVESHCAGTCELLFTDHLGPKRLLDLWHKTINFINFV